MDVSPVEVHHSGHCRFMRPLFAARQVVVVGGSISAGDMAHVALKAGATKVTWAVTRNPSARSVVMVMRWPFGQRFAWDEWPTYLGLLLLPEWAVQSVLARMIKFAHRRAPDAPIDLLRDRLLIQDTAFFEAARAAGRLEIVPATVSRLEEGRAVAQLSNGRAVPADVCVLATGYEPSYPFLAPAVTGGQGLASMALYRHTVAADPAAWGLSFLYTTSFAGSGVVATELEARWLVHQIAGGRLETEEQRRQLREAPEGISFPFRSMERRPTADTLFDIARHFGCTPSLWPALLHPLPRQRRVALAVALGPILPQMFRLRGPHARPDMASAAILEVARELLGWKFAATAAAIDLVHVGVWAAVAMKAYRALA